MRRFAGRPSRRVTVALLVAGAAAAAVAVGVARTSASSGAGVDYAGTALRGGHRYDFALPDQNGRVVRMSELRGKVVLLSFLFTHCEDECPIIAKTLAASLRSLGPDRDRVRVVAVSVDPDGDTPAAVRAYATSHRLGPQFHWLLGPQTALAPIWQNYNIQVEPHSIDKIVHGAPVYLLDRDGVPKALFNYPQRRTAIVHDIRLALGR
jgi:protein SCO1